MEKKNQYKNLLEKYPNIIEVCRKYDCNYEEAEKIIEDNKIQKNLNFYI